MMGKAKDPFRQLAQSALRGVKVRNAHHHVKLFNPDASPINPTGAPARPRPGSHPSRPAAPGWGKLRADVLEDAAADERGHGGMCDICGRPGTERNPLEADHRRPLARGGLDDASNLRAIHRSHNRAAGARLLR